MTTIINYCAQIFKHLFGPDSLDEDEYDIDAYHSKQKNFENGL